MNRRAFPKKCEQVFNTGCVVQSSKARRPTKAGTITIKFIESKML